MLTLQTTKQILINRWFYSNYSMNLTGKSRKSMMIVLNKENAVRIQIPVKTASYSPYV